MLLLQTALLALTSQLVVEPAPEWDALFDRTRGWTGADGIFSIPFDGNDRFGAAANTPMMFVFSDTFIGDVDGQGHRLPGTTMVNNTVAMLDAGAGPDPQAIQFYWRKPNGNPASVFVPTTPNTQPGEFYWMKDGIIIDGVTHLFTERMALDPPPFHRSGISLISLPKGSSPPFANQIQVETPLWLDENSNRGQVSFGGAIMDNTTKGNAWNPDGFVYVYGIQEDPTNKKALAARVLADQFTNFSEYKFWDGISWVTDISQSAPMCGRLSNEFSVTALPNGQFLMAFQKDCVARQITVRLGDSPVGPWGKMIDVYSCPVPNQPPGIFTYNAKAHPQISDPGTLLISYNVNTIGSFWDHFDYADIYRPRFIRLRMR
jgi:hypothetical protein